MGKQEQLDAIADSIVKNKVTPRLADGATQLVMGEGNPNAEVVFIGEAPGKEEDKQGLPFVGAAGKFLNEMLAGIKLSRQDVYITNIVKYRPPNNRDPETEEIQAFLPYLLEQIEVIQPKLIATLGRFSGSIFLPGLRISADHGQPKKIRVKQSAASSQQKPAGRQGADATDNDVADKPQDSSGLESDTRKQRSADRAVQEVQRRSTGADDAVAGQELSRRGELGSSAGESVPLVILPLYHPAAALYNGGMRQTLIDDFALIPKILTKINQSKTQKRR